MVLVIIGILCFAAIPGYNYLQDSKRHSDMELTLQKIRVSLMKKSQVNGSTELSFPNRLDEEPSNQVCKNCFSLILEKGVNNSLWYKVSETEYLFSKNGEPKSAKEYRNPGNFRVKYNVLNGGFEAAQIF